MVHQFLRPFSFEPVGLFSSKLPRAIEIFSIEESRTCQFPTRSPKADLPICLPLWWGIKVNHLRAGRSRRFQLLTDAETEIATKTKIGERHVALILEVGLDEF